MPPFTNEEFIAKARVCHGDKFDYSRVDYRNAHTKVIIGCPIHGWFEQLPMSHIKNGNPSGCNKCHGVGFTKEEKFWSYVDKNGKMVPYMKTRCWAWIGPRNGQKGKDYGRFGGSKDRILAHRLSWSIHNGPIPDGMFVLHKCDNMECTNPDHLFLGTYLDNSIDKFNKGRQRFSCGKGRKICRPAARKIRCMYSSGNYDYDTLGYLFGVSSVLVSNIIHNRIWKEQL